MLISDLNKKLAIALCKRELVDPFMTSEGIEGSTRFPKGTRYQLWEAWTQFNSVYPDKLYEASFNFGVMPKIIYKDLAEHQKKYWRGMGNFIRKFYEKNDKF